MPGLSPAVALSDESLMQIRPATPSDAPAIADIYAPIVRDTAISFESDPPTEKEMADRIARTLESHPWLVAEEDGAILGYAYASQFRARAAYRWTCEVTAYVGSQSRRGGVGRALYERLVSILRRQNYHTALAIITLPNDASVGFHRSLGFEPAGTIREVGFKFAAWHDVATLRLALSDPTPSPPDPIPYQDLAADDPEVAIGLTEAGRRHT